MTAGPATRPGSHDHLPVAVLHVDAALRTVSANGAWQALTGSAEETIRGTKWLGSFHRDDRERLLAELRSILERGGVATLDLRGSAPNRWFELRLSAAQGVAGSGYYAVAVDISDRKEREETLRFRSTHDDLTGLYNRFALLEHTGHALARLERHPAMLTVLMIDLDNFKDVNDRHGHAAGDRILALTALRFQRVVRSADLLARIGGDEFVVLCESLETVERAASLARRLLTSLREPMRISRSTTMVMSASVGIAFTGDPSETATALIARADDALYQAKRARGIKSPDVLIDEEAGFAVVHTTRTVATGPETEVRYRP